MEEAVLALRDRHRFGARKIYTLLANQGTTPLCSIRTITAILNRHGRIHRTPPPKVEESLQTSFERPAPNDLWQVDHKGPVEIARVKHHPWTVIDDHSRFCLCFEPLIKKSLGFAWPMLWDCFGKYGLPEAILSDRAFADRGTGISQFDQYLIRLGIKPIHGRPYHPQTQGKVERLHGTIEWELLSFNARTESMELFLVEAGELQLSSPARGAERSAPDQSLLPEPTQAPGLDPADDL